MALESQWHVRVLGCRDFYVAAKYAANKDWWLHAWDWVYLDQDEVNEYTRVTDK